MMGVEIVPKFGGTVKAEEVGLPVSQNGLVLPCGASGRGRNKIRYSLQAADR